ncbi:MAG: glycosyltransferase family 39 protein, partial [FCB group bacterium]
MKSKTEIRNIVLIIIIGVLFFIPYLGSVHLFDWDEINFAEASREMLVTGDYLTVRIDFQPFHEKPPLFFWLQAASMKIFGINEFASRFPNALTGIISLLFIYTIGKKLFDFRFGMLWVLTYIGSFLPFLYFKSGIIDPVFNLFIFVGMYFLYMMYFTHIENKYIKKWHYTALAGLFIALAVLTKGPVGYLLPTLSLFIFGILNRKYSKFPFMQFLLYSVIALLPLTLWYVLVISSTGGNIFSQFIIYQIRLLTSQEAGHGGPIYYHFVVLLLGCFPASIFMLRAFRKNNEDSLLQKYFRQWAVILLCVVLGVFSIVETKIIHYSSLAYFPITFLSAYSIYLIINEKLRWKNSTTWLLGIFGIVISILFISFPFLMMNIGKFLPKVTDAFTHELLKANVH